MLVIILLGNGKYKPSIIFAYKLALIFGTDVEALFRLKERTQNNFYVIVSALVALFYYYQAKSVGTIKGEDERDEFLEMKKNSKDV